MPTVKESWKLKLSNVKPGQYLNGLNTQVYQVLQADTQLVGALIELLNGHKTEPVHQSCVCCVCNDLRTTPPESSTSSSCHLQIALWQTMQPLEGCCLPGCSADQSDAEKCSNTLLRLWELKGQGGSCGLDSFMAWDLPAA